MLGLRLLIFFASAFVCTTNASGEQVLLQSEIAPEHADHSLLSPSFHAFVEEVRKNVSFPLGIAVGAVQLSGNGQQPKTYVHAWGQKTEDGDGNDLTTDTLFAMASCSKAFLATSVGLLIDDFTHARNVTPLPSGTTRLDWDTKIAAMLPDEWQLDDVWTTRFASIRDVLGHVSGLPRHDFSYKAQDSPQDVVLRMRHLPTAYELREKWSYNNQMYVLGSYLIAKYANTTYPLFVNERLFSPLNMTTTTVWTSVANSTGKLSQAWSREGRRIPYWFRDDMAYFNAGPGGVISSVEDMIKWLAVLINKGVAPVSGNPIVPATVIEAVTTAQHVVIGQPTPKYGEGLVGYGMGWERWSYDGIEVVSHTGGIPGFSSHTAFSPSNKVGVVILINADEQSKPAMQILKRAFAELLNRPSSLSPLPEAPPEVPCHAVESAGEPLSLDLDAYTGTYTSSGYGSITLCSPDNDSPYCADVVSDFASLGPVTGPSPRLYSTYTSLWSTHARLRHRSRNTFGFTFTALFPHGYGKNTTAFESYETGEAEGWAEFVVDGNKVTGFSVILDDAAAVARGRRTGGTAREIADAWFTKV